VKHIQLPQNRVACVDEAHFEELNKFNWCAQPAKNGFYVIRNALKADRDSGSPSTIRLSREVARLVHGAEALEGFFVDHINHDGLDNTSDNLRLVTNRQNSHNQLRASNNTSGYKGVSWHKRDQKWAASIRVEGTLKYLGNFTDRDKAAVAYNTAAKQYFGEHAYLNNV